MPSSEHTLDVAYAYYILGYAPVLHTHVDCWRLEDSWIGIEWKESGGKEFKMCEGSALYY